MDRLLEIICRKIEGQAPGEIQVIPYGVAIKTANGEFTYDEESAAEIIGAFEAQKNQMVIDYEHQTLSGTQAPAAGWIIKLINKGKEGLWAVVEWTNKAKEYLTNKEYKYVSPVFLKRIADNKVVRLINENKGDGSIFR
jgi:phage I-like protein